MANTSAFLVNAANNKKEITLNEDICAVIGRGILPSLVDKRCSRHQAEITFRGETQDALLFVVGPTPVAVQRGGSKKPHVVNVNESCTLKHGDRIMLIPDIDTQFEFQTVGGDTGNKNNDKKSSDEEVENKRKRSEDSGSDSEAKKKPKKKKYPCKYGAECFRKNPDHFERYSHGEDSGDSSSNEKSQRTKVEPTKLKHSEKTEEKQEKATEKQNKQTKTTKPVGNPFFENGDSDSDEPQPNIKHTKQTKTIESVTKPKKRIPNDDEDEEEEEIVTVKKEKREEMMEDEEKGDGDGADEEKGEKEGEEEEEEVKPLHIMKEAEVVKIQGDSGTEHEMKYIGGVYSCSCHAWRNQSLPIGSRTCKHLRVYLGHAYESYRLKRQIAVPVVPKGQKKIPQLLLAHKWEPHVDPTDWWVSEKLDGVRAYWDGTAFISRLGNTYPAPEYFTSVLPKDVPLDGELWCGRKKFQTTVSIVKSMDSGGRWKDVSYQVFDAPAMSAPVEERYEFLHKLVNKINAPFVSVVKTKRCGGADDLKKQLEKIEALGGEGLMLRKPGSLYVGGRSTTLLKVKSFVDDEAIVRAHEPGKGKHKGKCGSLLVELANGVRVSVGTGLSDAERANPPPVGSVITFRYQELTDAGVPRFPAFMRIRPDVKWPPKKD